ncbi:MAG: hypothetical protein VX498_05470, partial [Myxococcota bacterium]|nr:hypothetical protein [Myxococcota bacterium]
KAATRHLRSGGTVVALVDSLSSVRRGRRAVPFIEEPVGAPDALIAWAQRQGAALAVAVGNPRGFVIRELEPASVGERADRCVALLRSGIRHHPSNWAWVRALAMFALGLPMVAVTSLGCTASEALPPIPRDPDHWLVEVEGLEWSGSLPGRVQGRFRGARAQGKWVEQAPAGHFETILVELWSEDTGIFLARIEAERAVGTWPEGPLSFEEVEWQLQSVDEAGQIARASWSASEGWRCGGCALEALQP